MPHAILARVSDSTALGGVARIAAKLWKAIRIEIPIGYQDETGFHMIVDFDLFFRPACHSFPVRNRRSWFHQSCQDQPFDHVSRYQWGRQDRLASGFAAMRSAVKSSFEWHGCKDSNRFATNYDARTNQSKHRRTAKWNAD